MKAMIVTGFVKDAFPAKHLAGSQCADLGGRLKRAAAGRIHAFDAGWRLQDCWAYQLLEENPDLSPSCTNPPPDRFHCPADMVRSNIVLLQRYWWMRQAAELHPDVDVFAWVEYTALKQTRVTEEVIRSFADTLERRPCEAITLPGCWPKMPVNDAEAHWRFCGSCWICPRQLAAPLFDAVQAVASLRARLTGKLSWDMNTMAYVELLEALPIRWYAANHDETQFSHYERLP
jgi:hypothetical protein